MDGYSEPIQNQHSGAIVEVVRGHCNSRVTKWSYTCSECTINGNVKPMCEPTTKDDATRKARAHTDGHRVPVAS